MYAHIEPVDLAYAAGIIDGEGHIALSKYVEKGNRARRRRSGLSVYGFHIAVMMTEPSAVQWLHKTFGGSFKPYPHKRCKGGMVWRWAVCGDSCASLLQVLLPYLKTKQKQAEVALEFRPSYAQPKQVGLKLTPEIVEFRDDCIDRIKALRFA